MDGKHLDLELEVLDNIYKNADAIHQRDLARIVGLSLGMTNAIVKRLAQKGWLTIRKVNNRNIHYIVSPAGIEAITSRSYRYFKRTIKNVVLYREAIESLVRRAAREGYPEVVLVGQSDLAFIVEHFCMKHHIPFRHNRSGGEDGGGFFIYAEEYQTDFLNGQNGEKENVAFLCDLLIYR
jgi:DNA-binding MarR family transcriptional regulator